eukprot:COSAG04_NODE_353_length_16071_cov_8.722514_7_plen_260_part_00
MRLSKRSVDMPQTPQSLVQNLVKFQSKFRTSLRATSVLPVPCTGSIREWFAEEARNEEIVLYVQAARRSRCVGTAPCSAWCSSWPSRSLARARQCSAPGSRHRAPAQARPSVPAQMSRHQVTAQVRIRWSERSSDLDPLPDDPCGSDWLQHRDPRRLSHKRRPAEDGRQPLPPELGALARRVDTGREGHGRADKPAPNRRSVCLQDDDCPAGGARSVGADLASCEGSLSSDMKPLPTMLSPALVCAPPNNPDHSAFDRR